MKGEQMQLQYETVLQNTITLLFVLVLSIGQYWILRNVTGRFWSDLEFSTRVVLFAARGSFTNSRNEAALRL